MKGYTYEEKKELFSNEIDRFLLLKKKLGIQDGAEGCYSLVHGFSAYLYVDFKDGFKGQQYGTEDVGFRKRVRISDHKSSECNEYLDSDLLFEDEFASIIEAINDNNFWS